MIKINLSDNLKNELLALLKPYFNSPTPYNPPQNEKEEICNLVSQTGIKILDFDLNEMSNFQQKIDDILRNEYTLLEVPKMFLNTLEKYDTLKKNDVENNMQLYNRVINELAQFTSFSGFTLSIQDNRTIDQIKESIDIIRLQKGNNLKKHAENFIKKHKAKMNEIRDELYKIFDYDGFSDIYGYKYMKLIGEPVCPYCNRQYISIEGSDNEKGTRPDIEHFYPRSLYPYFSISVNNLLPSCKVCNSSFKGDKDFYVDEHIHPYFEKFGEDAVFNIYSEHQIFYDNVDQFSLKLINLHDEKDKVDNSNKTFKLENLYDNNHKDYALEIFTKAYFYPADYLASLNEIQESILNGNVRLLIGNYISPNDFSKRPLSKLTRDLFDQFDLWDRWKIDKSDFDKE